MCKIETYEILAQFRKQLIEKIIHSLDIQPDSEGIDMGCGIGTITNLLGKKIGLNGKMLGLDYDAALIDYAGKNSAAENIRFLQGDINNLNFAADSFDWIWSMDTVWMGPKEFGCPATAPDEMLDQLYQILKPGGKIHLLFWTSQKLLPGYPLLEARLNATRSANAPYRENMDSYTHVMNGIKWLSKANFDHIKALSFVGDISGPLNENDKKALTILFKMLWENSSKEISQDDWKKFQEIGSPDSDNFIVNQPDYYGYYTYTLFTGTKQESA